MGYDYRNYVVYGYYFDSEAPMDVYEDYLPVSASKGDLIIIRDSWAGKSIIGFVVGRTKNYQSGKTEFDSPVVLDTIKYDTEECIQRLNSVVREAGFDVPDRDPYPIVSSN